MKPSFYEKYGQGLDSPVGAVAHKLSNGGQDVLEITYAEVESQLKWWLAVNERHWAEKTTND